MNTSEASGYNVAYKLQRNWSVAPSPPNSSYNSRANVIWKLGGVYHQNLSANCPSAGPAVCWIVGA